MRATTNIFEQQLIRPINVGASEQDLPETWTNPRDDSVMRLVPAGEFIMGSTPEQIEAARLMDIYGSQFTLLDELPQFRALLPDFYLSECAVTNEQFAKFLNATRPSSEQFKLWIPSPERIILPANKNESYRVAPCFQKHPVVHVSWFGAEAYCHWAGLRLPREIEWEKAARGMDGRIFPWGNEWDDNFLRWNGDHRADGETTAPVDAYPNGCSPFGIYQMAGNVDEWCAEPYQWDIYQRYVTGDLRPPTNNGTTRVVRGGTCIGWQKIRFRCAHRRGNDAAIINIHYAGIRCACDLNESLPAMATEEVGIGYEPS